MKTGSMTVAACMRIAVGFVFACASETGGAALHFGDEPPAGVDPVSTPDKPTPAHAANALPDIGTKMPDGTVYAGLSMETGKPSFVAAAGGRMPDGTIYAGISPDTGTRMYTTAADAPDVYTWNNAAKYCKALAVSGHADWRMPSIAELGVQFGNRADIGGFNETGRMDNATGYYWSSLPAGDQEAWAQRFSDGFHEHPNKDIASSLRCVR